MEQISDEEHARRARETIASQWNTAKKQETRRMLEEVRMADAAQGQHGLLAAHGLNGLMAGGVKLADGMTTETADVLLMHEPEWQKDELSTHCNTCKREFSMTRRKHHCRACGMVVCNTCSRHRALHLVGPSDAVSVRSHQVATAPRPLLRRQQLGQRRKMCVV